MRNSLNKYLVVFFSILIVSCNSKENKKNSNETINSGETIILVDETLKPIIEDQVQIFESRYKAKINIKAMSETEVIQVLIRDSSQIAILARKLTENELRVFANKKIVAKTKPFAVDAIALIINKNTNDTIIAFKDIVSFLHGNNQRLFKGLVFDNPNSSTVSYILEKSGLENLPVNNVFSFKTNDEVIRYVAENEGMIGVIGVNYIYQPIPAMQGYLDKINVLSVKDITSSDYISPTQNNIAEGKYPLARELYIINCQGFAGLGMGFTSFLTGDVGQRIILKSGLMPVNVPPRKILIKN